MRDENSIRRHLNQHLSSVPFKFNHQFVLKTYLAKSSASEDGNNYLSGKYCLQSKGGCHRLTRVRKQMVSSSQK